MKVWLTTILVVLAAEIANYYLGSPVSAPITGAGISVLVTGVAFMALSVYRWHRREVDWWLITLSLFWFAAGASVNYSYLRITGSYPYPGPGDAVFLLTYPTVIAGLLVMARSLRLVVSVWDVIVALTVTVLVSVLLLYPLIIGPSSRLHVSLFTRAVTIAYPVADALLFCVVFMVILAMSSTGSISLAYWLVLAGVACLLISDTVFAYVSLNWLWDQPSAINLGWFAWFVCWTLAALWPHGERSEVRAGI